MAMHRNFRPSGRLAVSWWQWPHLLSLDAPLVAVCWQWWWAATWKVSLSWRHHLVLGLAVWMIYLADRLSDASLRGRACAHTDRHEFYARYRGVAAGLLVAVIAGLTGITPFLLGVTEFVGGLVLLSIVAFYYWMIHLAARPMRAWLPKEAVVGGMFALGTVFFTVCQPGAPAARCALDLTLFGILCFLNCALISRWEQSPEDLGDPASLLRAFPRLTAALPTIAMGAATFAALLVPRDANAGKVPIVLSALALWAMDRFRARISPAVSRVCADLVLFTPLLVEAGRWMARWKG